MKMKYKDCVLFLAINGLFVLKYTERTPLNPLLCLGAYIIITLLILKLVTHYSKYLNFPLFGIKNGGELLMLSFITLAIAASLIIVDPMTIRVDRWSATTNFLDALFSGDYPYGAHTHVSLTNYPSPFPLWHYLNIPFWLVGDVGIGLIAILWIFYFTLKRYASSSLGDEQRGMFFLLLLLSPAYWWEVVVRSDGLSNALLVFCVILWLEHKHYSFKNRRILVAVVSGLVASTRLSAIIPLGLYLLYSYFKAAWRVRIMAPLIALGVVLVMFLPYILWDTHSWVFFSRNPFMSQTSTGNIYTLLLMAALALAMFGMKKLSFSTFANYTSIYIVLFFALALCYNHYTFHSDVSLWEDADFDISYLTLALPYSIYLLSYEKSNDNYSVL